MNDSKTRYIEVLIDVIVRFKAHEQYKSKNGALKSLKRRIKDSPTLDIQLDFDTGILVYTKAKELIESRDFIERKNKSSKFADPEDIQFDELKIELKKLFNQASDELISGLLNWTIYWYYLK